MSKSRATAVGFIAVILWAMLAVLTAAAAPVPPLQLNAICFAIGGGFGLVWLLSVGGAARLRAVPIHVYLFGTVALFGYHALYFAALRAAPPAEAGLIAYLWPLLIVLMSGALPGERLRLGHFIGGLAGLSGVAILLGGDAGFNTAHLPGYLLALGCALTWSFYSVASRRMKHVQTESVVVFCLGSAVLSLPLHFAFETTAWPETAIGWGAVLGLGLGPVGAAFYVWDFGVKKGDIQLLGVASYAAPLLSTGILIVFGFAEQTPNLILAVLFVTGGAILAARASNKGAGQSR